MAEGFYVLNSSKGAQHSQRTENLQINAFALYYYRDPAGDHYYNVHEVHGVLEVGLRTEYETHSYDFDEHFKSVEDDEEPLSRGDSVRITTVRDGE